MRYVLVAAAWYVAMSTVMLVVHWRDKRAAERGRWRVAESTLHIIELLGGWPGTLIGQRLLRHKSRKMRYRIVLALIACLHVLAWLGVFWLISQGGEGS